MHFAHFESNRAPRVTNVAASSYAPSYVFYSYAYQAMLEVRSSGE